LTADPDSATYRLKRVLAIDVSVQPAGRHRSTRLSRSRRGHCLDERDILCELGDLVSPKPSIKRVSDKEKKSADL
jgi:hypothetical protein